MHWVFQALPLAGCALCLAYPLYLFIKRGRGNTAGPDDE